MAMKCFTCGKGRMVGKKHTHHPGVAGGRWKKRAPQTQKIFKPNLHIAHILIDGTRKKVKLCTKCLRRAKEAMGVIKNKTDELEVVTTKNPRVLSA